MGRTQSDLLSNYVNLVEKDGLVAPMITYAYREHLYASLADLYGSGHLPDSLCALALATKGVGVSVTNAESVAPDEMEQRKIHDASGRVPAPGTPGTGGGHADRHRGGCDRGATADHPAVDE